MIEGNTPQHSEDPIVPREFTEEEQEAITQQRAAYISALEGRDGGIGISGKVKQIISAIRGGKLSEEGELRMILDAEREDKLWKNAQQEQEYLNGRNARKPDTDLHTAYAKAYVDDYQTYTRWDGHLTGIVNGQHVDIYVYDTPNASLQYRGTVNGQEIPSGDASRIYYAYKDVAEIQRDDLYHHNQRISEEKRLKKEAEQEAAMNRRSVEAHRREGVTEAEIRKKSADVLKKLGS